MSKLSIAGGSAVLMIAGAIPQWAEAQAQGGATVISGYTCPSSGTTIVNPGNNRPLIETQNGALCTNGSGGSSSGSSAITIASGAVSSGAYASGAITDLGSGANPSQYSTNGWLSSVLSAALAPLPLSNGIIGPVAGLGSGGVQSGGVVGVNSPNYGTPTQAAWSCTSASTTLLPSGSVTEFILIQVSNGGSVYLNFTGAAAVTAPPSEFLTGGQTQTWNAMEGYLPTNAITCITTGTVSGTVIYK